MLLATADASKATNTTTTGNDNCNNSNDGDPSVPKVEETDRGIVVVVSAILG
jgi:hypothetical protein